MIDTETTLLYTCNREERPGNRYIDEAPTAVSQTSTRTYTDTVALYKEPDKIHARDWTDDTCALYIAKDTDSPNSNGDGMNLVYNLYQH